MQAAPLREKLKKLLRLRPMLDALHLPRANIATPTDDTVVKFSLREELTAGPQPAVAAIGQPIRTSLRHIHVRA